MGWIRVSDDFYDNDKFSDVGPLGVAMFFAAMGFCNRNLTDGFFRKNKAKGFLDFDGIGITTVQSEMFAAGVDGEDAASLVVEWMVAADLWHEQGHDCVKCHARSDGGDPGPGEFLVHDYLEYQSSKAEIEEKAEANRKRVEAWREARKGDKPGTKASGNSVGNDVGNALHTDVVQTPQTQPQTQPQSSSLLVTSGGGVTKRNARESSRPHCADHEENSENPCPACLRRRLWDEEHAEQIAADEVKAKRDSKWLQANCIRCHGTNTYEDSAGKCWPCSPHQHPSHQEAM